MHFLIIRRLRNSELGWFAEFRRQGRETAKQRGINFDAEVVERVFPSASSEKDIQLSLSFRGDNGIKTELHPLKRQHKNWRLVGTKIEDEIFGSVDPEDLFLLSIDAIGDVPRCQFSIHKPESPMGKFILTQPQTLALANNSMIAIHSSELGNIEKKLVEHDSELYHTLSAMKYDNQMDENINEDDLLQIPDAGRLIDALSNIGYSLNAAVSDIIDNSIEAGAKNINITFPDPNKYGRILSIADDGSGMTPKKLVNALCIGSSR